MGKNQLESIIDEINNLNDYEKIKNYLITNFEVLKLDNDNGLYYSVEDIILYVEKNIILKIRCDRDYFCSKPITDYTIGIQNIMANSSYISLYEEQKINNTEKKVSIINKGDDNYKKVLHLYDASNYSLSMEFKNAKDNIIECWKLILKQNPNEKNNVDLLKIVLPKIYEKVSLSNTNLYNASGTSLFIKTLTEHDIDTNNKDVLNLMVETILKKEPTSKYLSNIKNEYELTNKLLFHLENDLDKITDYKKLCNEFYCYEMQSYDYRALKKNLPTEIKKYESEFALLDNKKYSVLYKLLNKDKIKADQILKRALYENIGNLKAKMEETNDFFEKYDNISNKINEVPDYCNLFDNFEINKNTISTLKDNLNKLKPIYNAIVQQFEKNNKDTFYQKSPEIEFDTMVNIIDKIIINKNKKQELEL